MLAGSGTGSGRGGWRVKFPGIGSRELDPVVGGPGGSLKGLTWSSHRVGPRTALGARTPQGDAAVARRRARRAMSTHGAAWVAKQLWAAWKYSCSLRKEWGGALGVSSGPMPSYQYW